MFSIEFESSIPNYNVYTRTELELMIVSNSFSSRSIKEPYEYMDDIIQQQKNRNSTYDEQELAEEIYEEYMMYITQIKEHIVYLIDFCGYRPDDISEYDVITHIELINNKPFSEDCILYWYTKIDHLIQLYKHKYY